nr:MAG TPA: hypothetical protein [Caudoviricetes sp.]DAY27025.1 MAG TPA: hypothetical protein [Caudoviricetes sp.]
MCYIKIKPCCYARLYDFYQNEQKCRTVPKSVRCDYNIVKKIKQLIQYFR